MEKKLLNKKLKIIYILIILIVLSFIVLINSDSLKGSLIPADNMIVDRTEHTSTLLKDGKILITGGGQGGKIPTHGASIFPLKGAEIYNPITNKFSRINDMNFPHLKHYSILIPNGKVLILDSNFCEEFDPKNNKFTVIGKMNFPRYGFDAIQLPDGDILILGGLSTKNSAPILEVELYDIKRNIFLKVGKLKIPRSNVIATLLNNEKILVLEGSSFGNKYDTTSKGEIYDYKSHMSYLISEPKFNRAGFTATKLQDGKVLIAGGINKFSQNNELISKVEIFDPNKEIFYEVGTMKFPRRWHQTLLLSNNNVLFVGGQSGNYKVKLPLEVYNPDTKRFSAIINTDYRFSDLSLVQVNVNKVLITGGLGGNYNTSKSAFIFNY